MKINIKKIISYFIIFILIPFIIIGGIIIFESKKYVFISICVALSACIPFFLSFEKRNVDTKRILIIAVMTALSVVGRFAFYALPHFKPVTAIVVIAGMYLGAQSGFLCGALSAVISNILFGQGPWTPFQMFGWGLIGLLAALLSKPLKKSKLCVVIYGAFSGILFSLLMDLYSVVWIYGSFGWNKYAAVIITSFPVTIIYAISNIIFLLLLAKPLGEKLDRIIIKYGI